jgi:hypothetical protein
MILKQDNVIKLRLESLRSGNLIHFQLEQRKSNLYGARCETYREKKILRSAQLIKNFNLTHACTVLVWAVKKSRREENYNRKKIVIPTRPLNDEVSRILNRKLIRNFCKKKF